MMLNQKRLKSVIKELEWYLLSEAFSRYHSKSAPNNVNYFTIIMVLVSNTMAYSKESNCNLPRIKKVNVKYRESRYDSYF